jgi:hypothetical protein
MFEWSGSRHMHALDGGFSYRERTNEFAVQTLDTPVVALGERTPLLFSNDQPDLSRGVHSCLYNNSRGTNYIIWYGEDAQFRYLLKAQIPCPPGSAFSDMGTRLGADTGRIGAGFLRMCLDQDGRKQHNKGEGHRRSPIFR